MNFVSAFLLPRRAHGAGRAMACLLAMAALGSFALPAQAQLKSQDILGITLGQSAEQVEAALRAKAPTFQIVKVYWRGLDNKATNNVAKIAAGIPSAGGQKIDANAIDWRRPDSVAVYFTQSDSRVVGVYRQVHAGNAGMLASEFKQALTDKYGPSVTTQYPNIYNRGVDASGQTDACTFTNISWGGITRDFKPGCWQSIKVQLDDPIGAGVYQSYRAWLYDHRIAEADAKASQAQAAVQQEQANRKAVDAAKGQKQAL